jgi:hypothetical protein
MHAACNSRHSSAQVLGLVEAPMSLEPNILLDGVCHTSYLYKPFDTCQPTDTISATMSRHAW